MFKPSFLIPFLCTLSLSTGYGQLPTKAPRTAPVHFTKKMIASETYESVGVFDVNGDGSLDIVSGAFWYEGPEFIKREFIVEIKRVGEYWDDFANIPMDVNGDGKMDFITGGWFGAKLNWIENPGDKGKWKEHRIDETGNVESIRAWDIDKDGLVEIVPNTPGHPLKFYKLKHDAQNDGPAEFTKIEIFGTQGHGLGFGDINRDGRGDIILAKGWLEAPPDPLTEAWEFHAEFDFGDASVPIIATDVNEDGITDLIVGQGHSYGLDWHEQSVTDGKRTWTKHPIDPFNSQFHTMEWADIDGDGKNELITGKRYRAHNGGDPGANDPVGLYYYKWNGESFTKNVISYGPAGEGKGAGIYFSLADLRNNGRKDVIVAGKDGLYVFFNEGTTP